MKQTILNKLDDIQQEHGMRLLFACESGSRGWQFPSADSDYDVRFVYILPYRYYLSVLDRKYDLRFPIDDELDMYGWDIRKVLQLIRKSNTTPFEWLQSPVVYRQEDSFKEELWSLCQHFFSRRSNIHHYLGIAKGALDDLTPGGDIKIKKLFYVLRPLLAAKWCLEQNSIAPMTIGPLMTLLPAGLQLQVSDLIAIKENASEQFVITISDDLKAYIDKEFSRISAASGSLARDDFSADKLDDYFISTITRYDY